MSDVFSGGIMPQVIQNRQGLQNLEAQRAQMDAMQRQQQAEDEANQLLMQYQQSAQAGKPDNNLLYSAVLKSPTASKNILSAIGVVDTQQKQRAASDIVTLKSALKTPQQFYKALATRIDTIKKNGGDPKDTIELGKMYQSGDIEGVENALNITGAALANEGFIKPKVLGFGSQAEPMTAFQAASTNLRQQELEFNKQQKMLENQLKTMEAQARREDNELKRQQLQLDIEGQKQKIADNQKQKETTSRERDAELNQAYFSMDNMLNTVERIKKDPSLDSVLGTVQGRLDSYFSDDAAATIRLIDGLGSQAFMAMVPSLKGMGALSNAEGDKLAASLQNLSRVTSEDAFRENLNEVERLIKKSRSFLSEKYGKPQTEPDTPAAESARGQQQAIDWSSL